MAISILHFSDFHLDGEHIDDAKNLLELMCDSLKDKNGLIDIIVFTGDMINKGGHGFGSIDEAFKKFEEIVITKLCETLSLSKERFIFIPGNHDIDKKAIPRFGDKEIDEDFNKGEDRVVDFMKASDVDQYTARMKAVKTFEKDYYTLLYTQETYSYNQFQSNFKLDINGIKVGITSLNTVWRSGVNDEGKIVLGLCQIDDSVLFISDCQIKIAATHYRYDKLKEFERDSLKKRLADEYDVFLSGHTHSNHVEFVYESNGNYFLDVNTSGSLTNNEFKDDDKHRNAYQIITIYPNEKVEAYVYRQMDGSRFYRDKNFGNNNGYFSKSFPKKEEVIEQADILAIKRRQDEEELFLQTIFPISTLRYYRGQFSNSIFENQFETNDKIEQIKQNLVDQSRKRMRFMALSGMGKTRIVFDVFNNRNDVYYSPTPDCKKQILYLLDRIKEGVLIIDNCPIDDLSDIQKILSEFNSNIRIVSIHNELTPKEKRYQDVLILDYEDTADVVDKLLDREVVLEGNTHLKSLIKERSGNIPFMAVLMIEAYKKQGNLEIADKDQVLKCLLKSSNRIEYKQENALKALSMFEPLGYLNTVSDEYRYVANSFKIHNIAENQETIDRIFEGTINTFKSRQLIEIAGSCLRVRPKPLAEWLTEAWMDENESTFGEVYNEIINQEEGLSNRLSRALDNRFVEMTKSNRAKQIFDKYNNPVNGSFHDERVAFSKSGSRLFLSMGVVSPVMVAKNLESLIYAKSVEWLRNSLDKDVRRNLIWAMENIVMDAEAFDSIAKSLGRLALAENESISNNATGQFLQLFHIILSGTKANLDARLKVIEFFKTVEGCDELLIKALDHALNGSGFVRSNTSRYKSVNTEPEDYYPYREEVCKYWMHCLDVLERIAKKTMMNRLTVNEVLVKHVTDFQKMGMLSDFLDRLDVFAKEVDYNWNEMRDALSMNLHHWFKGTEEERIQLILWIEKLAPQNFYGRLETYVKDERNIGRKSWRTLDKSLEKGIDVFADEFLKDEIYKTDELRLMIKDKQFNNYWFLKSLTRKVSENELKALFIEIYNVLLLEEHSFESPFVISLSGMIQNKEHVETLFEALHKDGYYRLAASLEGVLDAEKNCYLNRVIEDVKCGRYDNSCINNYLRYGRGENIQVAFDNYDKMRMEGIDLYEVVYPYLLNLVLFDEVKDIEAKGCLERYKNVLLEYPFSQDYQGQAYDVIEKIGEILDYGYDSDFAMAAHKMSVKVIVENSYISNLFEHLYFKLLPKYQDVILDDLMDTIAANDIRLRFYLSMNLYIGSGFGNGKGPLFQCDEQKLKDACKRYPSELPERLARMCPVYEYEEQGPVGLSKFFLWLCDNYGDNEEMLREFGANMGTLSWSGVGGFSNYIAHQKKFIEPLLSHPNITVRKWAEMQRRSIDDDVKRERDKEEYSRMVKG